MEKIAYETDFSEGSSGRLNGEEFTRRFGNKVILNATWSRPNQPPRSTLRTMGPERTSDIEYNLGRYSSNQRPIAIWPANTQCHYNIDAQCNNLCARVSTPASSVRRRGY